MTAAGGQDPQMRASALMTVLQDLHGGKRFTLDKVCNASAATGCSVVLPNGSSHLLSNMCWDTGATTSILDAATANRIG
jgi:hypothetical protein